jgi:hypothetical protein
MPGISRPLTEFRRVCQELLSQGISPTPGEMVQYGYSKPGSRTFPSGHYNIAREQEYIRAGWRRVQTNPKSTSRFPNHTWRFFTRKGDKSEGHKVVSKFRIGDTVRVMDSRLVEDLNLKTADVFEIGGYESGWHLDRDDLPSGATALCLTTSKRKNGTDFVMVWDDEIILVEPAKAFPLKMKPLVTSEPRFTDDGE